MAEQAVAAGKPGVAPAPRRPAAVPLWRNPNARAVVYQIVAILAVILVGFYLVSTTMANLQERGIRSGFSFLKQEAGFFIGETLIPFQASDSYARAFLAGVLNTLYVSILGIVLSTVIGTTIGIARLSKNWLLARVASGYVELIRNIPLLLQLFFWYSLITGVLPPANAAINVLPGIFLSKSGLAYPMPKEHPVWMFLGFAIVCAVVLIFLFARWAKQRQDRTGETSPVLGVGFAIFFGLPFIVWLAGGAPTAMDVPTWQRFRFAGGSSVTPEFLALLMGLTLYTAGFIAEIVRSGILAVPWGQTEAASALGLRRGMVLRLVILPQALRVIVPPMTSQFLNITKNSSLAVAIGYPDLVSVANTTLNQTGQAIECISIMMAIYLVISLSISAFMNWYNRRVALVER